MATPGFFDFHLHPIFKKFICQFDDSYPSTRDVESLLGDFELTRPLVRLLDEELLHILGSQASIQQLQAGPLSVGVAAIAPIERLFSNDRDGGLFGKVLNSGLTAPLDLAYMNKIREGQVSYYQLFIREVSLYKRLHDAKKIQLLTRQNPNALANPSAIPHLALSLEGGHGLCRTLIGRPGQPDKPVDPKEPANPDTQFNIKTADSLANDFKNGFTVDPAKSLRQLQQALWTQQLDLFYLGLTHLSYIDQQHLATHAYGIKMLSDVSSYPVGNGLSTKGLQVVDAAYNLTVTLNGATHKAPVLIDIKHLSLKSRLDLYAYRKQKNYALPLIASHIGVTGYSISAWQAALSEASLVKLASGEPSVEITVQRKMAGSWGVLNRTFTYNAWSINLMDEDIEAVLVSDGLIGVSLDVRILGWQDAPGKGDKAEFMSPEEFRFFFPDRARQLAGASTESELLPTKEERHPLALCFNLLHIVSVGKIRTDKDPWAHVCIGSDYDGLINPVINCRNVSQLNVLEDNLLRWLPIAERAYRDENGGSPLLHRNAQGEVDENQLKAIVRSVLYTNGEQFMSRWLTNFPAQPQPARQPVEADLEPGV